MRGALLVTMLGLAIGCGKKDGTRTDDPADAGPAQDLEQYTTELKSKTPIDAEEFKRKGLTADSYVKDEVYTNLFREVTLQVPRVRLRDALTGREAVYTKARLVRNDPAPPKVGRNGYPTSVPEPFAWVRVEMLP